MSYNAIAPLRAIQPALSQPTPSLDLARLRRGLARILEKQNRLQMSQVFSFSCIDDQMGVAFQGFYNALHQAALNTLDFSTV